MDPATLIGQSRQEQTSCLNASPKPYAPRASLPGQTRWGTVRHGAVRRSRAQCGDGPLSGPGPRFLDSFLTLLGAALASADTFAARLRLGRFIGMVSSEENTYFLRAFEALGVAENRRAAEPDTPPTASFKAIMREAAQTRLYAAALSVLVVTEWLYLDWASRAPSPAPGNFVHTEWVALHDNPDFRGFVDFLRAELDRVGPLRRTCAATSFVGLSPSNSHSSKPLTTIGPDTVAAGRGQSARKTMQFCPRVSGVLRSTKGEASQGH